MNKLLTATGIILIVFVLCSFSLYRLHLHRCGLGAHAAREAAVVKESK